MHRSTLVLLAGLLAATATPGPASAQARHPDAGLAAWQREFGPGWTVWPNANGTPHRVFGPGALIGTEPVRTVADARAAAAAILAAHGDWFGAAFPELEAGRRKGRHRSEEQPREQAHDQRTREHEAVDELQL